MTDQAIEAHNNVETAINTRTCLFHEVKKARAKRTRINKKKETFMAVY